MLICFVDICLVVGCARFFIILPSVLVGAFPSELRVLDPKRAVFLIPLINCCQNKSISAGVLHFLIKLDLGRIFPKDY